MSRYSAEDALAEVYDAELCSSDGEVRLYVGRNVVLTTPDDVLGTVLATVAEKARDHYPGCRGLDSDLAAGGGLPPIEHAFQPTTDTCNLLQLASRPHCNGIPANGSRFQEWERQMIETMKPGGEQASFVTHGDCEYLVPYRLYDPFVTIGSQFYALPALPELTPSVAREYGPSDTE